jgi:hypothetical protein
MSCCYDSPPWGSKKPKANLSASLIGVARLIAAFISFFVSGYAIIYFKELTAVKLFILLIFMVLAWALHSECRRSTAFYERQNKVTNLE